jgi:hypothetical protein
MARNIYFLGGKLGGEEYRIYSRYLEILDRTMSKADAARFNIRLVSVSNCTRAQFIEIWTSPDTFGITWLGHGTGAGDPKTNEASSFGHPNTLSPATLPESGSGLRFLVLASCYSESYEEEWRARMKGPRPKLVTITGTIEGNAGPAGSDLEKILIKAWDVAVPSVVFDVQGTMLQGQFRVFNPLKFKVTEDMVTTAKKTEAGVAWNWRHNIGKLSVNTSAANPGGKAAGMKPPSSDPITFPSKKIIQAGQPHKPDPLPGPPKFKSASGFQPAKQSGPDKDARPPRPYVGGPGRIPQIDIAADIHSRFRPKPKRTPLGPVGGDVTINSITIKYSPTHIVTKKGPF